MSNTPDLAPEYRYFTADLMTNEILAEIPFRGVTYERAIKGAGAFSGKIPVLPGTRSMSLYQNTSPGNTGLYIVRDNVCVWGGIIWARDHNVVERDLTISASEFPSYFYHRRIWKTWNHQYGARIVVADGSAGAVFENGSTSALKPGASVHLAFYDPADFRYSGYYKVASTPSPTTDSFSIEGAQSLVDVVSVELVDGLATVQSVGPHGFSSGDLITVSTDHGAPFNGTFTVTTIGGLETDRFSYAVSGEDIALTLTTGTATRPLPSGIYSGVTVTVRADTYDYIRSMVEAVFKDFVGIDFPNAYIEPGLSYRIDITEKELGGGWATITTGEDHNLAVGQAVQIVDLDPLFDGEHIVTEVPTGNVFRYAKGGSLAATPVFRLESDIVAGEAFNYVSTLTTSGPHGYRVGQMVSVFCGFEVDGSASAFNGDFIITEVPSSTTFKYAITTSATIPPTTFTAALAAVGANTHSVMRSRLASNVVTLTTEDTHSFEVGQSVTISGVNQIVPIREKSLDAPNSAATVSTARPHEFQSGSVVTIDGLRDASPITRKSATTAVTTLTTTPSHNFRVGDSVTISDMQDVYLPTTKALSADVATITTSVQHNLSVGAQVAIANVIDTFEVSRKALADNTATVTTSAAHNFQVNDEITVGNIQDDALTVSKEASDGFATVTTAQPHNYLEAEEITVSGVGAPFDGTFKVVEITDTRVIYEIESDDTIAPTRAHGGSIAGTDSIFNGTFVVESRTDTSLSFARVGNDVASVAVPGGASPQVSGWSALNGTYPVASVPSATTFTFAKPGNSFSATAVPLATADEDIQATVSAPSIHLGSRIVTAVTPNTFSFSQAITRAIAVVGASGQASAQSVFNGQRTITSLTADTFKFALSAPSNVLETTAVARATATDFSTYNGTYTITVVGGEGHTFSFVKTHVDVSPVAVAGLGSAVVAPGAVISTFGPFPGSADLGIGFSTREYSGTNIMPVPYRGFEMVNVGEALDAYSDSIDGFEYRIDCAYEPAINQFTRTFVLLPIDFPNPPAPGEVSPPSRFGADQTVFEYPGNIINVQVEESAENSATRFFAIGENDLGPDAGPPFSVATAEDLLNGTDGGRKWPLLDDDEQIEDITDESVLYAYARRYLNESRPPDTKLTVSVNGSLQPLVGSYAPGDWCSLIVDDEFLAQRLASGLEPRDNIILRKIDSYKVSVPDGTTFPERVSLTLVPEWEVDRRG